MRNPTEEVFKVLYEANRPDLTVHLQLIVDERDRLSALAAKVADGNFNQPDIIQEARELY